MRFDVLTIFPEFFDSFLEESLIEKALEEGLIDIRVHDLREFAVDKHRTVDDRPFGGGYGMVFKVGPIYRGVKAVEKDDDSHVILFTPRGKKLTQKKVTELSKHDQLVIISGRYEGVDERVSKIADEEISIGDYVLLGGEIPAMAVIESVSRLVPGVIGGNGILDERVNEDGTFWEYEQYTRPRVFETEEGEEWEVPEVLLSGDHKEIEKWRKEHSKEIGEEE